MRNAELSVDPAIRRVVDAEASLVPADPLAPPAADGSEQASTARTIRTAHMRAKAPASLCSSSPAPRHPSVPKAQQARRHRSRGTPHAGVDVPTGHGRAKQDTKGPRGLRSEASRGERASAGPRAVSCALPSALRSRRRPTCPSIPFPGDLPRPLLFASCLLPRNACKGAPDAVCASRAHPRPPEARALKIYLRGTSGVRHRASSAPRASRSSLACEARALLPPDAGEHRTRRVGAATATAAYIRTPSRALQWRNSGGKSGESGAGAV